MSLIGKRIRHLGEVWEVTGILGDMYEVTTVSREGVYSYFTEEQVIFRLDIRETKKRVYIDFLESKVLDLHAKVGDIRGSILSGFMWKPDELRAERKAEELEAEIEKYYEIISFLEEE